MSFIRKSLHPKSTSKADDDDERYADIEELRNFYSGWLSKKTFLKTKKVWCTLNGKWLSFWKDTAEQENSGKPKSSDCLDMCTANQVMRSTKAKADYAIDILTSNHLTVTLIAATMKEFEGWIQSLQTAMQYKRRAESIRLSSVARQSQPSLDDFNLDYQPPYYEDPFDMDDNPKDIKSDVTTGNHVPSIAEPLPAPSIADKQHGSTKESSVATQVIHGSAKTLSEISQPALTTSANGPDISTDESTVSSACEAPHDVPSDSAEVPSDSAEVPSDSAEVPSDSAEVPSDSAEVPLKSVASASSDNDSTPSESSAGPGAVGTSISTTEPVDNGSDGAALKSPVSQSAPLPGNDSAGNVYEEVDITPHSQVNTAYEGNVKCPMPAQRVGRPQPAVRRSIKESSDSPPMVKPLPRPSIKRVTHVMPAPMPSLPEAEGDTIEEDEKVYAANDPTTEDSDKVEVVLRGGNASAPTDGGLPSVEDLYAEIIKKKQSEPPAVDRVSNLWNSIEEKRPEHVHSKIEPESQGIKELRRLLNAPPPSVASDTVIVHSKQKRGEHMQALYEFLCN